MHSLQSSLILSFIAISHLSFASPAAYIVDCVQAGSSIQSYFAYYSTDDPYSQKSPDVAIPVNPSSGVNQYSGDISVSGLGDVSMSITKDYPGYGSQTGSLRVNKAANWRCYDGGDRFLYADTSKATTQQPFAQCLVRHQCQPVPAGGKLSVKLQYAIECGGGDSASCGDISPAITMFYTIYDYDMSTTICTDAVEMSGDTDDWIGHDTVSDKCNTSVYVQSLDYRNIFGGGSWDAKVSTIASNGASVQCGLENNAGKITEVFPTQINEYTYGCSWS